jgi:hypothetical protein
MFASDVLPEAMAVSFSYAAACGAVRCTGFTPSQTGGFRLPPCGRPSLWLESRDTEPGRPAARPIRGMLADLETALAGGQGCFKEAPWLRRRSVYRL